ncbi:hypothetical protein Pst134EA_004606 [Puccinia striiformis f. sp. tritici]|uniref:hypothetical protein n=1 Tax=Puccinia striiformis f. sp. tritici TaxID=168172 RepID=UPI0020075C16|nr:hypothetical protein Pst134EA_004606 [Puccinia striiformis f. sp. tritici]KAH9470682.1 hypothetical protein Pst134EA_004606 [Puccinia striiformis f. sp. tritici]
MSLSLSLSTLESRDDPFGNRREPGARGQTFTFNIVLASTQLQGYQRIGGGYKTYSFLPQKPPCIWLGSHTSSDSGSHGDRVKICQGQVKRDAFIWLAAVCLITFSPPSPLFFI